MLLNRRYVTLSSATLLVAKEEFLIVLLLLSTDEISYDLDCSCGGVEGVRPLDVQDQKHL